MKGKMVMEEHLRGEGALIHTYFCLLFQVVGCIFKDFNLQENNKVTRVSNYNYM